MSDRLDVLIAGAGATGLTLACDLMRRGVRTRVIDAAAEGFPGSRAKGLQARTQEIFHDLGLLDDINAHARLYPKLGIHLGPLTVPKAMFKHYEVTDDVPYPNILLIAQSDTDRCLQRRLIELGGEVERDTRLLSYTNDQDGIVVEVAGPRGHEQIRARFLVGADGASSTVRRHAELAFTGTTDEADRMIVADVIIDGLARDRWHVWPRPRGRFMGLCPLPDGRRFQLMFRLRPGQEPSLELSAIDALVHGMSGLHVSDVTWASVFRPNVRLVERYRDGNVLLAGDAAHVHPPTGAQGLNTGVQDAYNLGWKLGQVLAGAPDALLDSYDGERRPVAANVLGLATELYAGLSNRPLAASTRGDDERQLAISYAGGPLADETAGTARALRTGDRAPDAPFSDGTGGSGRVFDSLKGPHFTLLAVGDSAATNMSHIEWPDRGATLRTVQIPTAGASRLSSFYGLDGPARVLIRPDGYVACIAAPDRMQALTDTAKALTPGPA